MAKKSIAEQADAAELLAALNSDTKPKIPTDKLDYIRNVAKAMRALAQEIEDAEAELSAKKIRMYNLQMKELPDLFDQYNIPSLTLGAEGNNPEVELEMKPYYKAVLPKDEDDNVLPAGLRWLDKNKHGDLIKRVFVVSLPRDSVAATKRLQQFLIGPKTKKKGPTSSRYQYEVKETVPWNTLTAFVREQIEAGRAKLPLEILGATVGKIVKMKVARRTK